MQQQLSFSNDEQFLTLKKQSLSIPNSFEDSQLQSSFSQGVIQQYIQQQKPVFIPIEPPEDLEWPLFRFSKEPCNRFWTRKTSKDLNRIWFDPRREEYFAAQMLRVGKKKKSVKGYYFRLNPKGVLMYFKKQNDSAPKGYIQLSLHIRATLHKQQTKKNIEIPIIIFERQHSVSVTVFDHQAENTLKMFDAVKTFCLVRGFNQQYTQHEMLGQGSFASVYRVVNIHHNSVYAAKTYFQDTFKSNSHKDKFLRMVYNEMLALKELDHPGLMKIFEIYQEKDKLVFITEFVPQGTLYSYVRQKKKLSEKLAATLLRNIAEALNEMHTKGFVHRDLKLENIMLESKETLAIKLVVDMMFKHKDFGFAERINENELMSRAGTPGFIPPEVFKLQPYTGKGDVFSVGVIFYSIFVGKVPFKAANMQQIIELNRKCQVNWEVAQLADVSNEAKYILKKMLEAKPADRFSCAQILECPWIQANVRTESNYFQSASGLVKALSYHESKSNKSLLYKSDSSKSFQNDFSYHTNDMKSFYQKNSLTQKTVNSQRSNISLMRRSNVMDKQRSISAKQSQDHQEIRHQYTQRSHKTIRVKQVKTNFHELQQSQSFGDQNQILDSGRQIIFAHDFDDTERPSISFLKQGYRIFNQPKKPQLYSKTDQSMMKKSLINKTMSKSFQVE